MTYRFLFIWIGSFFCTTSLLWAQAATVARHVPATIPVPAAPQLKQTLYELPLSIPLQHSIGEQPIQLNHVFANVLERGKAQRFETKLAGQLPGQPVQSFPIASGVLDASHGSVSLSPLFEQSVLRSSVAEKLQRVGVDADFAVQMNQKLSAVNDFAKHADSHFHLQFPKGATGPIQVSDHHGNILDIQPSLTQRTFRYLRKTGNPENPLQLVSESKLGPLDQTRLLLELRPVQKRLREQSQILPEP